MRIHHSQPETGFTIIPNATLRDQRLSTTARGVLVDLLSRPDGWQTNADAMVEQAHRCRPDHAEGRRMMRGAYAELEALGYLKRTRVRQPDGTIKTEMDVYDTAQNTDRGTGTGMSDVTCEDERLPSSHRGTAYRPSVGGTSIERLTTKTETKNKDLASADAEACGLTASAVSESSDDADASSAAAKASARDGDHQVATKKPRRVPLDRRLDEHLAGLGADAIARIYDDLCGHRSIMPWATKQARTELNLEWSAEPDGEPGSLFMRLAVAKALLALSKPNGGGIPEDADAELGAFDWPDHRAPSARRPPAKERPKLPRVTYIPAGPGVADDSAHRTLYAQVDALPDDEFEAKIAQFRRYRPRVWRDSERAAREQIEKAHGEATGRVLANLAFKYAIQHYKGRWPMFVVPVVKPDRAA